MRASHFTTWFSRGGADGSGASGSNGNPGVGGGGGGANQHSAGGGAGGLRTNHPGSTPGGPGTSTEAVYPVTPGTYAVVIGAGGAGSNPGSSQAASEGSHSIFNPRETISGSAIRSEGGGDGAGWQATGPSGSPGVYYF